MKKHNHFLRKLTAGLLGFVMTLGVGAAGYAGAAGETRAADVTYKFTPDASTSSNSATSYVTSAYSFTHNNIEWSFNQWNPSTLQIKTNQSSAGSEFNFKNTSAFPGKIKSVVITFAALTVSDASKLCFVGGTSAISSLSGGSAGTWNSTAKTLTWTPAEGTNYTYFAFYQNGKAASGTNKLASSDAITVTYEKAVTKYDVSFNMQGHGSAPSTQSIEAGGKVAEPTAPSVSGYIFGGWYEEAACTNKWNFSTGTISGTKVLYAKWTAKTALTLTAADVNMKLGDSDKSVTVTAGGSAVSGFTLTSGNTNVISIVNNQLHVVGLGDATITITKAEDANNTYTSGTFNVHVDYADIASFVLDYEEGTLGKGGEATLPGVTILPANANQGFSWGDPIVSATSGEISYTFENGTLSIAANNTGEGTITFVATADGDSSKSADVVYTIEATQIAHITGVSASATGAIIEKQYVGDAFNPQGFSFAPSWSEGDHEDVEITADDISWNALVAGSNPTGTYLCADGEFTVTITGVTVVNDTLVSIAFADGCDMTKKTYWVGDSWDFSGLSIVGTMDSGAKVQSIASSDVTFSSNDVVATTTTQISVTATYQGLTTTTPKVVSDIEVKAVTMDSLTVSYTGGKPYLGEDIVFAGTIKGNMSNGTEQNVSVSDVDFDVNPYITDQQTVNVTHKTTGATGTFNVQYQVKSYTEDVETSGSASWTANKNDNLYKNQSSTSGTLDVGIFSFNWEHNGYNGWGGDTDGHRLGQSTTGSITFTSSTPTNVKITGITVVCGGNKSASSGSTTVSVGSIKKTPINFSGAGNADREFTFEKATGAIEIEVSCNSLFRMKGITINYVTVDQKSSTEKHAIRIGEVTCSKSPLIAGETISKGDFKIQVQYDTGTALTSNLVPTSVSPTTLVAGTHDYTITYTGSYNDTVTKVIQLTAQAPAVLESISITKDVGCDDVFTRCETFTHNGIHVIAHYTDSTTYPDVDVTAKANIPAPDDMDKAGTKTINVSYEENEVKKTTSYQITVNPIVSTYLNLSGKDIVGSNGIYTLNCGVENKVTLSFSKDGDEEITVSNPTSFLTYDETTGELTVNSQTTESESGIITFTAGSKTAALTVVVTANPLTEFVATGTPDVSEQFRNDSFELNLSGIEIHGVYADETYYVFYEDDFEWDTTGDHPVGTYKENTKLTVTVNLITLADDSLKSIAFADGCDMTKKSYWVGDSWDFSGLSITGEMNSKETASIVAENVQYSTNAVVATETTSITVTATYQGLTATKEISGIEVKAVTMDSLTINYTGGQPVLGTDFTFAGSITANMSNGKTQSVNLSDVTIGQVNKFITDQQTITVTHKTTGATGTFNVTYKLAQYWETEPIQHHYSYKLVTEDLSDWSGQYLIVYEDDNNSLAFDGSLTAVDSTPNTFEVGIVNNEIVPTDEINGKCFTIAKSSEGKYSIKNAAGYYIGRNASGNGIDGSTTYSSSYDNTITYSNGTFIITGNGGKTLSFNTASNQMKFRYLGSTLIKLYKYVDTPTGGGKVPSLEKHPIRIVDANLVDNTSVLIGDSLTKDDFNISVQYDTSTTPVSEDAKKNKITPTSIQKKIGNTYSNDCTLSAGDNIFKLTYSETYDGVTYTVEKEITVPAAEKTLNSISLSYGDSFKDQFGLNDTFTHEGVIVTANYANGYKSEDVTNSANVSFSSPDMTTAGEKTVTVTYTEGGVSKTATYIITVTAEKDANLVSLTSEDLGTTVNLIDEKSGSFEGYVGNTVSFEIKLINFGDDVDVLEKTAVDGLSFDGSVVNSIYYGEIEVSKVMDDQEYIITVSDGEKDVDVVLSFTAIEDYIESIEVSNYQEEYTVGDDFNYEMTVTATYASGNTRVLEDNEYDVAVLELTRGNHNVTVTLNNTSIQDSFSITVNKPDDLNIVTYYEIPGEGSYQLVTDASQITVNGQYALGTTGAFINSSNASSSAYQISSTETEFRLSAIDGGYLIYCPGRTSNKYLANSSSTSASWNDSGSTFYFTKDSESGYFYIQNASNSNRFLGFTNGNHTGVKCYATSNIGDYDFVYLYKYVPGQSTIGYKDNTDNITDALFDFVYAWGGDNLDIANWKNIFESTEYAVLNKDDKVLLQYAVVESKDGTKVTTEMFADFITTYDEIVAKYGPSYNELDREVEYEVYNLVYENIEDAIISDGSSSDSYQAGSEITLPTDVKKEGYTFKGWFTKDGTSTGDWGKQETGKFNMHEDVTLYAKWEINKYTVTWKNGDTVLEIDTNVPYGTMPEYNGTTPTKASDAQYNYTFTGWAPEVSSVTGDVTYVAQFSSELRSYTVTWKDGDSTLETDANVPYGTMPEYNGTTPTKASDAQYNYTFSGWAPEVSSVTGDVTYVAQFSSELRSYTVIWKNYDGTILETDPNVNYGTTPEFNGETPTKPSTVYKVYTFNCWDPEIDVVTGDITYTAQFKEEDRIYYVTWIVDGVEDKREVQYGETPSYGSDPVKPDTAQYEYEFVGWTPNVVAITEDAVYTAVFKETVKSYTITFKNGDVVLQSSSFEYGSIPQYSGATPNSDNKAFVGWSPSVVSVKGEATYQAVFKTIASPETYAPIERENYDTTSGTFTVDVKNEYSDVKTEAVINGVNENGTIKQTDEGYVVVAEAGEYKRFVEADIVLLNDTECQILVSSDGINYVEWDEIEGDIQYVKFIAKDEDTLMGLSLRKAAGTMEENAYGYVSYTYHDNNTVSDIYAGIAYEYKYEDERLSQYQGSDEYTVMFIYGYSDEAMTFDELWNSSYNTKLIGDDKLIQNQASLVLKFKGTDTAKFDRVYSVAIVVVDKDGNLVDYSNVVSGSFNELKYSIADDHAKDPNLDHILLALVELGVQAE